MKTLITGTPGWLGTKLAKILVNEGKGARCLVHPDVKENSLSSLGVEIVRGDITNPATLKDICKNVSVIFHCAGIIHPKRVKQFYEINTTGTHNLLKEAIKNKVEKFIYVSSNAAAIADNYPKEVNETDIPHPFMHYGLSKLKAENIVNNAFRNKQIKTVIIRPNWMYGIGGPERQLRFIKMVKNRNILIFSNGKTYRSLCHIDNCIQALLLAQKNENAVGKTFFIADKSPYKILEIYKTITDLLEVEFQPRIIPLLMENHILYLLINRIMQGMRFYYPEIHMAWEWSKNVQCSIKKAEQELGYKPQMDFSEGMKDAIDWYKQIGISL